MPSFDIDFSVYCSDCGAGLCNDTKVDYEYHNPAIYIAPCQKCLEKARDEGYEKGCNDAANDELETSRRLNK